MNNISEIQEFINNLLIRAGDLILKYFGKLETKDIRFKNPKDMVTEADMRAEEFIKSEITKKIPEADFVAEESFRGNIPESDNLWIIDPLDGTTNFVHTLPIFAVSISFLDKGVLTNAGTYIPILKELYYAEKGKGAYLNNKRIKVSQTDDLKKSILATGFACLRKGSKRNNLIYLPEILPRIRGIRRYGAATYDFCCVASGKIDGFWELELGPWDMMAGSLIVEEAGGKVTDFSNEKNFIEKREVLATNGLLHNILLELLNK